VQKLMEKFGMTFVAFSPLAQARLLDKYDPAKPPQFEPGDHRKDAKAFSAEAIAKLKPKLAKLKERFGNSTEDLVAVALNYVLAHPRVACVIPGFRNERQARSNLSAMGKTMSVADIAFVRATLS
jgi:aryl-alcohol dehydrogenase-like predicted oxidoreductase